MSEGHLIQNSNTPIVRSTLSELFLYFFVSVFALVLDAGTLFTLADIGVNYIVAATLGFLLGLAFNYVASVRWVFHQHNLSRRLEFILFAGIGLLGLLFNDGIIFFVVHHVHASLIIAKLVSTVIVFGWNFGARKYILFTK